MIMYGSWDRQSIKPVLVQCWNITVVTSFALIDLQIFGTVPHNLREFSI